MLFKPLWNKTVLPDQRKVHMAKKASLFRYGPSHVLHCVLCQLRPFKNMAPGGPVSGVFVEVKKRASRHFWGYGGPISGRQVSTPSSADSSPTWVTKCESNWTGRNVYPHNTCFAGQCSAFMYSWTVLVEMMWHGMTPFLCRDLRHAGCASVGKKWSHHKIMLGASAQVQTFMSGTSLWDVKCSVMSSLAQVGNMVRGFTQCCCRARCQMPADACEHWRLCSTARLHSKR